MRLRIATSLIAGFMLVMFWVVPAQASVSYTISPTAGPAGTTVTFTGTGCPQETDPTVTRAEVRFEVFATVGAGVSQGSFIAFGGAQSNPDGSYSGTTSISANAEPGVHQTQIVCTGGRSQGATFTVTAAVTTTSSTTTTIVPTTSSSTTMPAAVAPATTVPTTSDATVPTTGNPAATDESATSSTPADDQTTVSTASPAIAPAATNNTTQLNSTQKTGSTTSTTLALTGLNTLVLALVAICVLLLGIIVALFMHTPAFPRFEEALRQFGEWIADPHAASAPPQ